MPTEALITTTELAVQLGLDAAGRRHLRGWVRRRLVTPARTDDAGFFFWDESGVVAVARVRAQYLARLARLAAAVGSPA